MRVHGGEKPYSFKEGKRCGPYRLRCAGEHNSFYTYVKNYVLATRRHPHIPGACNVKSSEMDNELNARVRTYCCLITSYITLLQMTLKFS